MTKPSLDPPVADEAPASGTLTDYDRLHLVTYLRLLDAAAAGAAWEEVSRIVLKLDPQREPVRARRCFDTHVARARWMTEAGYADLLGDTKLL